MSHRIDIFYLLDSLLKLTWIITYFQTCEHEKLITTFFTRYFPSLSVCHKHLRFCWKLLQTIYLLSRTGKINYHFFSGKKWKNVNLLQPIYIEKYINTHRYIVHLYIDISNAIYRYFQYIDISLPSLWARWVVNLAMTWMFVGLYIRMFHNYSTNLQGVR